MDDRSPESASVRSRCKGSHRDGPSCGQQWARRETGLYEVLSYRNTRANERCGKAGRCPRTVGNGNKRGEGSGLSGRNAPGPIRGPRPRSQERKARLKRRRVAPRLPAQLAGGPRFDGTTPVPYRSVASAGYEMLACKWPFVCLGRGRVICSYQ